MHKCRNITNINSLVELVGLQCCTDWGWFMTALYPSNFISAIDECVYFRLVAANFEWILKWKKYLRIHKAQAEWLLIAVVLPVIDSMINFLENPLESFQESTIESRDMREQRRRCWVIREIEWSRMFNKLENWTFSWYMTVSYCFARSFQSFTFIYPLKFLTKKYFLSLKKILKKSQGWQSIINQLEVDENQLEKVLQPSRFSLKICSNQIKIRLIKTLDSHCEHVW